MYIYRRIFPLFAVVLLSVAAFAAIRPSFAVGSNPTGLIIPLYTYPTDGTWASVLNAKNLHPTVPIIAVINPNSGPGTASDANYVTGIKAFQAAGITVLGYVATHYTLNLIANLEAQILLYKDWYGVNGIMFDEMGDSLGQEEYYSTLNLYVKSLGMTYTMGNPGTSVPTSFIGILDNLAIYENPGYPAISVLSQYSAYSKTNFGMIAYGVGLNTAFLASASVYVSWLWVTNDNGANPYDSLPSYFPSLVAALDLSVGSTMTVTTTATTTQIKYEYMHPQFFVVVASSSLAKAEFSGMFVTVAQNGTAWKTGFTGLFFVASYGNTYQVCVSDYQTTTFSHWDDGTTNPCRMIYPTGSTLIVAFYNT